MDKHEAPSGGQAQGIMLPLAPHGSTERQPALGSTAYGQI
jgi:hypothetical protein